MLATTKTRKKRFRKNTRQKPRKGWRRLLIGLKLGALVVILLLISALFVVGYAAVTQSDFFRVQSIEVYGNAWLTSKQVIAQAMLTPQDNVLAVNLHLVRKRLLAQPWIASAQVMREIPGILRIFIEEHKPLAVVDLGRQFLINTAGRIFKEYVASDPRNLPLVTGIAYTDISLGAEALSPTLQAVCSVLQISRRKHSIPAYAAIESLHVDPELGVTITQRKTKRVIKLGSGRLQEKYVRLSRMLAYLQKGKRWRELRMIDVNNPDRVIVRF